jgi:nitroreductase
MEFQDVMRRRRMIRNFTDEPVDRATIERIIEAGQHAPSAGFSQGVVYVVVTDDATRREIAKIGGEEWYVRAGHEPFISRAPVHILVCTSEQVYHDRYNEPDKKGAGQEEIGWPIPYWHTDAGASLMLVLLAAVDEGLGTAFIGVQDPTELQRLLRIPDDYLPIGIAMVGHPAPDKKSGSLRRGRRKLDDVLHWESWDGSSNG